MACSTSRTRIAPAPARRARVRPDLRVSDADRDLTIARLREHAAHGRLDLEELEERVERAQTARLGSDLLAVEADLPAIRLPQERAAAAQRRRVELRGHVGQYLAVMALLVAIWALTGAGYFWPIWPILGWGIGVVSHAIPVLASGRRRALHA